MTTATSTRTDTAPDYTGLGSVSAVVAITGWIDDAGDRLSPGCFARTLAARRPGFTVGQDWNRPAGVTTSIRELPPADPGLPAFTPDGTPWPAGAGALVATARYIDTRDGRDARAHAQAADTGQAYGIGFRVPDGGATHRAGVRHIDDVDLYTWGPVLHGTSPFTRLTEIKSPHPGQEVKAVTGTAIHAATDPVDTASCALCGRAAMGSPATGRPIAPGTVMLTCADCLDRLDDLAYEREGTEESEGTAADLFTTSVTCALCGGLAGGVVGGPAPDRDVICPGCVAAMRELAADTAAVADGDQPATTGQGYDQALGEQRHLTIDAGADLVPDTSATGVGWSPAGRGRRRY